MLSKLLKSIGILFFLSGAIRLHSQTAIQFEKAADQAYHMKDFYSAFVYYKASLKRKVKEDVQLKSAIAAYEYGAVSIAKDIIEDLLKKNASQRFESLELYHGFCLFSIGEYKAAKYSMNKYLTKAWHNKKRSNIDIAKTYIEKCDSAIFYSSLAKDESSYEWKYDNKINSSKAEFAIAKHGDLVSYSTTSRNAIVLIDAYGKKRYLKPKGLQHKEEVVFFEMMSELKALTCVCKEINQLDRHCKMYYWNLLDNKLTSIGGTFDNPEISFSQPYIDLAEGMLYYSAEVNDNKDLFSFPIDSLGTSTIPVPLDVNTDFNEESPFVKDGVLYFASDRDKGLGGYDIYSYELGLNGLVENLGSEINSSYNENYFRIYDDQEFMASNRPLEVEQSIDDINCLNIYNRSLKTVKEEQPKKAPVDEPLTIVTNDNKELEEIPSEPIVDKNESEDAIVSSSYKAVVYFPNNIPLSNTTESYDYKDCFQEYAALIDYYLNSCPEMDDFESFYAAEVIAGLSALEELSAGAESHLKQGKKLTITINAYTSPRASKAYNMSLSERRCKAVLNYLIQQNPLLNQAYEKNLIIVECNSYGELMAPAIVSEDYFDLTSSVYSIAASRERRVECYLKLEQ